MKLSGTTSDLERFEKTVAESYKLGLTAAGVDRPLWKGPYGEDDYESRIRFIYDLCETWDDTAQESRRFPRMDYLEWAVWHWTDTREAGEPLLVFKARRMVLSWLYRACELHRLGLKRGKHVLADDEFAKSQAHIWRYHHIYEHLRAQNATASWNLPAPTFYGSIDKGALTDFVLPNGSVFTALNSESQKVQGAGATSVTLEEIGTYINMHEMVSQALIITKGAAGRTAGHVVMITNAVTTEEFAEFVKPSTDHTRRPNEPAPPEGCEIYRNKLGVRVLGLDYWADPGKRSPEWEANERIGISDDKWEREYLRKTEVLSGSRIFPEYEPDIHARGRLRTEPWPMARHSQFILGIDCGGTVKPAAVLLELRGSHPATYQLIAVKEWTTDTDGIGAIQFLRPILTWLMANLPAAWDRVLWVGDATVNQRSGSRNESFQSVADDELGVWIHQGTNVWELREEAVRWALNDFVDADCPRFYCCEHSCKVLAAGFRGRYVYRETKPGESAKHSHARKDKYSHPQDALQEAIVEAKRWVQGKRRPARNSRRSRRR